MKIVKFKNGKYGVRRWSWLNLSWVFAINHTNEFAAKSGSLVQEFASKGEAERVLKEVMNEINRLKDMGEII